MFAQSLLFNVVIAKSEITPLKKIAATIRIVWSSASFARVVENIQRTVKQSSFMQ
jgi:hypothetical protein